MEDEVVLGATGIITMKVQVLSPVVIKSRLHFKLIFLGGASALVEIGSGFLTSSLLFFFYKKNTERIWWFFVRLKFRKGE
jgi:hypothetical protein